jgi:hypothetical protein
MNYKIVKDEKEFNRFLQWLPELEDGQKFYFSLFARKKFGATEGLKADKGQLKRFTASKEQALNKIKKLEVELGSYEVDGVKVNQDSLVLYVTPNPRDMHKAGLKTAKELVSMMADGRTIYNPQSVALNQIQVTGVKKYFDIDLDFKEGKGLSLESLYNLILDNNLINSLAVSGNIIKTRGGFHILVELDKISESYKKKWFTNFSQLKDDRFTITMNNDNMIPVPGCVQSDFIPKLV